MKNRPQKRTTNKRKRKRANKREEYPASMKASNGRWKSKRLARYNATVWRGWRESDGVDSEVTVYKASELREETTRSDGKS